MRRCLVLITVFTVSILSLTADAGPAGAGPNANGALIMTLDGDHAYSAEIDTYCGTHPMTACEDAVVQIENDGPVVLHVFAAFAEESEPRLAAVTFGVEFPASPGFSFANSGHCGNEILTTGDWPESSGSHVAIIWEEAQTGLLTEVCWFGLYAYASYGSGAFRVGSYPSTAMFVDDRTPSQTDNIAFFGAIGFFEPSAPPPCPVAPIRHACCFQDECVVLSEVDCARDGGVWMSEVDVCEPYPCPTPLGGCCIRADCEVLDAVQCRAVGGEYQGAGTFCAFDPCIARPTIDTSWGRVKSQGFRQSQ